MVFDELKYKETSELVKTIRLDYTNFDIFNIPCRLFPCSSINPQTGYPNGGPAMYANPSYTYDIYLWEDIPEKIQRPLLFHEIVEIYHRKQNFEMTPAHNIAIIWEERFCYDYLSKEELGKYIDFQKNIGLKNLI